MERECGRGTLKSSEKCVPVALSHPNGIFKRYFLGCWTHAKAKARRPRRMRPQTSLNQGTARIYSNICKLAALIWMALSNDTPLFNRVV